MHYEFIDDVKFQFTLSRGERLPSAWVSKAGRNFNSHSHEESDCIILLAFERILPYINFSRLNFFYCTYSIKLKKRLNEVRTSYINYNSLYFALIYQNCLALMILVGFSQY